MLVLWARPCYKPSKQWFSKTLKMKPCALGHGIMRLSAAVWLPGATGSYDGIARPSSTSIVQMWYVVISLQQTLQNCPTKTPFPMQITITTMKVVKAQEITAIFQQASQSSRYSVAHSCAAHNYHTFLLGAPEKNFPYCWCNNISRQAGRAQGTGYARCCHVCLQ